MTKLLLTLFFICISKFICSILTKWRKQARIVHSCVSQTNWYKFTQDLRSIPFNPIQDNTWPCINKLSYTRPCKSKHDNTWPYMTLYNHAWPFMTIHKYNWPYMIKLDHIWSNLTIYDNTWQFMTIPNHRWPCMIK